jgi:hypothetical protein
LCLAKAATLVAIHDLITIDTLVQGSGLAEYMLELGRVAHIWRDQHDRVPHLRDGFIVDKVGHFSR